MGELLVVEVNDVANDSPPSPPASISALAKAEVVVLVDPRRQEARLWKWRWGSATPLPFYVAPKSARAGGIPAGRLLGELLTEIVRQDEIHPQGYGVSRDAVRLALACVEDELTEALRAWDDEKREDWMAMGPSPWPATGEEALTAAAVIMRLLRDMGWHRGR